MTSAGLVHTIPNYLTFLRLALIPVFVVLLIDPSPAMINAAIIIFLFAAITDYIDGFIARRWGAVSDFGKILDPLADKILVAAALIMLTSLRSDLYGDPWVPGPMVVLVMAREIWVTGLRAVAGSQGLIVPAGTIGKWKSFLQMLSIVLLLLHNTRFTIGEWELSCQMIGILILAISLVFSYASAFEYSYDVLRASKIVGEQERGDGQSSEEWPVPGVSVDKSTTPGKPRDEQIN